MTATGDRLRRCQARRNRSGNRIAARGPLPLLMLAALGWLAACSDSTSPGDPPDLVVTVTPPSHTIEVGETADLTVAVSGGEAGEAADWTCTSSAATVASAVRTGTGCRVTGEAAGGATVTVAATKGAQSAEATAAVEVLGDPAVVAALTVPNGASGVIVRDALAYVRQGSTAGTLAIVDVADPTSPVVLGSLGTPGVPLAFALAGDHAYLASQAAGLQIVDVSDPADPTLVGVYDQVHARGVALAGSRAYVMTGTCFVGIDLVVVDVADAAAPALVDSIPLPDCSPSPRGATLAGSIAYVWPAPALVGIDVGDPAAPVEVSRLPLAAGAPVGQVWIEGSLAYVTPWEGGSIEVFDIGDPADPASLGSLEIPGVDFVYSPVVAGDELYVLTLTEEAGGVFVGGVEAIDVRDPTAPTRIGRVELPPETDEEPGGLAIDGRYAYVTVDPRLYVIDLGRLAR